MKIHILLDGDLKAILPGNLNGDRFTEIIKMYLFNQEFKWKEVIIREEDD